MARACVVVADDNESLRYLLVEVLRTHPRAAGFAIEESDSAMPALDIIDRRTREGDKVLVITDYRMPGMTGVDLVKAARAQHPRADLRLVVLTSAESSETTRKDLQAVGAKLVVRPISLRDLRGVVDGFLADWV